jgi:hypothetical protein
LKPSGSNWRSIYRTGYSSSGCKDVLDDIWFLTIEMPIWTGFLDARTFQDAMLVLEVNIHIEGRENK